MSPTLDARSAGTIVIGGDLRVARIGFGARWLAVPPIWPDRYEEATPMLRRALELGINLIDTANVYGAGVNEMQIAQALRPYANELVIATKAGMAPREPSGALGIDGDPVRLRQRCDESLERLGLEHIDLFQLHVPDPKVPWPEQVGALRDLRAAGKIRHAGLCNVSLEQLHEAERIVPIVSVQNRYTPFDRSSEDVLRHCETNGIAFMAHRPFGGGDIVREGLAFAKELKRATSAQVVLAWLLRRSAQMLPIPGTHTLRHLEENVAAASLELDEATLSQLD